MPGPLFDSPHRIIQQLLVDLGMGIDPESYSDSDEIPNEIWPVYYSRDPDTPDDLIVVWGTQGRDFGWTNVDSEREETHGIQVMVRSYDDDLGARKAREIAIALDTVNRRLVTVSTGSGTADTVYLIAAFNRTTEVIPLGRDTPQGKRSRFTINGLSPIRQCQ